MYWSLQMNFYRCQQCCVVPEANYAALAEICGLQVLLFKSYTHYGDKVKSTMLHKRA